MEGIVTTSNQCSALWSNNWGKIKPHHVCTRHCEHTWERGGALSKHVPVM